jgi:hypothetical protein
MPMKGQNLEASKQHFTLNGQAGTNLLAVVRGRVLPHEYVIQRLGCRPL